MKTSSQITGRRGEDAACLYLISLGHTIVARNWRHSHQEIDIISLYGEELHIVEVKSRTVPAVALPELNVNARKRRLVAGAASAFLLSGARKDLPPELEVCFDIIAIIFDGGIPSIEYYPRAYYPLYY